MTSKRFQSRFVFGFVFLVAAGFSSLAFAQEGELPAPPDPIDAVNAPDEIVADPPPAPMDAQVEEAEPERVAEVRTDEAPATDRSERERKAIKGSTAAVAGATAVVATLGGALAVSAVGAFTNFGSVFWPEFSSFASVAVLLGYASVPVGVAMASGLAAMYMGGAKAGLAAAVGAPVGLVVGAGGGGILGGMIGGALGGIALTGLMFADGHAGSNDTVYVAAAGTVLGGIAGVTLGTGIGALAGTGLASGLAAHTFAE